MREREWGVHRTWVVVKFSFQVIRNLLSKFKEEKGTFSGRREYAPLAIVSRLIPSLQPQPHTHFQEMISMTLLLLGIVTPQTKCCLVI